MIFGYTCPMLYIHTIASPIGDLIAIANNDTLLVLEFGDSEERTAKIGKIEMRY